MTGLHDLTTISSIIDESLRLDPSALFVLWTVRKDFAYESFRVPREGNVWAAHNSRHVDPHHFRRERSPTGVEHQALKAFGHGQRRCPGASLARALLSLYVVSLVSRREIAEARSSVVRAAGFLALSWADRHFCIDGTPR